MDEEELEKLHKQAERYVETSGRAVRETIHPQIEGFKKSYNNYFKELATASGVIAGATTALLSSSIPKIQLLTILGLVLLIIVVVFTFLSFKKGLMNSVPYVQYLKKLSRELTDFSYNAVIFSRKEITPDDFQTKEKEFKNKYYKWRDDLRGDEIDLNENRTLFEMHKWSSEINIITSIFVLGIISIALSIIIPLIIPFFC